MTRYAAILYLAFFGIEQNDAVAVQPVACSLHRDFVSKPVMKFAGAGTLFQVWTLAR
jgi:hypothetical protein